MSDSLFALKALIAERSIQFGEFTLASGATSNVYVDIRQTSLTSDGASLIGECIWTRVQSLGSVAGVGGLTLGADPLVTATAIAADRAGSRLAAIIVRKKAKEHGTGRRVEAPQAVISSGDRVIALDDTTTTGGSTIEAIEVLREAGYQIEHAICVVDRNAGARENLGAIGVELHPLFELADFEVES